jgi:hypothetical protein
MNNWPHLLSSKAPPKQAILSLGFSEIEAEDFLKRFRANLRTHPLRLSEVDPIMGLFENWDMQDIRIGQITFENIPSLLIAGEIRIGRFETDPLVVTANGEVVVKELGPEHVLWRVAKNSESFLLSLLPSAKFFGERAVGIIGFQDFNEACKMVKICSGLAGGDSYTKFFTTLLGAEQ